MKRRRAERWRWLLPLLWLCIGSARSGEQIIEGQARDPESGALLYSERHACGSRPVRCEVEYRDPRGVLIARKELDYQRNPWAPALSVEDFRAGETIELTPPADPSVVVDAGFDNYIRDRWRELSTDEEVSFPFLAAGQQRPFRMVARRVVVPECDTDRLCLEVRPESWWLRLLVEPIELVYDRGSQRLLLFRGISNLSDGVGEAWYVEIRYTYRG